MITTLAVLLMAGPVIWTPRDVPWTELPAVPEGKGAVLWGDPTREANGQLKRFPGGAEIPPHKHTQDQRMLVISGTLLLIVEDQAGRELDPGAFAIMPAGTTHSGICKRPGPCIVYEEQPGASDFILVDPATLSAAAPPPAGGTRVRATPAPAGMSRRSPADRQNAVELLWQRFPEVTWGPDPYASADLDADGTEDLILVGRAGEDVVVGMLSGPVGKESRRWTMKFPVAANRQDALCSAQVTLSPETPGLPLAEMGCGTDSNDERCRALKDRNTRLQAVAAKGGRGVRIEDAKCDAFHIYWDGAEQKLRWWRR
jgi:hypothetical protein